MDASARVDAADGSAAYLDRTILALNLRILKACVRGGLDPEDAADLAQDLWEWLIRNSVPMTLMASRWLDETVRIYVLRFRRRYYIHRVREGQALEGIPEPQSPAPLRELETNELLDKVAGILPRREGDLLALIRAGHSMAEAARLLGIPRGSCAYYQGRLVDYARRQVLTLRTMPSGWPPAAQERGQRSIAVKPSGRGPSPAPYHGG